MPELIQAIRGMNDILPEASYRWQALEARLRQCMSQYAYDEIRLPLAENTALFKRTIGEVTDIVEKEMYTFTDLNGDSISLRPEGTAGTVRAALEHGLLHNQQQRLWYLGPMFRHEKPQKGRYRQFYHFGVEVFGIPGAAIELELLMLCQQLWKELGIQDALTLEINSIGTLEERSAYKKALVDYFTAHQDALDADSQKRLTRNPMRILDSKNPEMQQLVAGAPALLDWLGEESKQLFDTLCEGLQALGIAYKVNPRLVRGLDYYSHTVFEWVTPHLGSQATVCAGGRFDKLVSQLGGRDTPAVGFAMGIERLLLLLEATSSINPPKPVPDLFIIADSGQVMFEALGLAGRLREAGFSVLTNTASGSFKSQFKKADKSGATLALILGEQEMEQGVVGVKWLRDEKPQSSCKNADLIAYLREHF